MDVVLDSPGQLPTYARAGDAGADLRCTHDVTIAPGERVLVHTGVRLALPEGHVGLVTPRSGLAARTGLSIVNAPGVIDSGYRGEVLVCLVNLDPREPVELSAGDRIAQLLVMPFVTARFSPVDDLDETERGSGGYGSTGVGHQIPERPGRQNQ
ncbi:dUTP diphosphatase [Tessaracoccus terricola]